MTIAENRISGLTLKESEPNTDKVKTNKPQRVINADKLKNYFKSTFKGAGSDKAI